MTRVASSPPRRPAAPAPPGAPDPRASFLALLTEEGQDLLGQLRGLAPADELATATRLRRAHPPSLVSAALTQARLRQRAAAKFGAEAERMYFTPEGVEQATRAPVAARRAERFAALGVRRIADLCCGIGGDALALARAGLAVLAVDRDPLTCAVAEANAAALGLADRIEVRREAVEDTDLAGLAARGEIDAVFADPARRGGRGRVFDPEAYSPPLSWALGAARHTRWAALKLAPGLPHEAVPEDAEAEWVSHRGEVKEAVLWFGTGRPAGQAPPRRATLLPSGVSLTGTGAAKAPTGPPARYLYEPDGAVIRAHLVAEAAERLGGHLLDPTIAYIASDRPPAPPAEGDAAFATAYEVTDVLPFHVKRLRALLRERGVGTVTVKKRGSALTPEELLKRLKPQGPGAATVFLTRVAGRQAMLLARPFSRPE
ncbi:THUMP-like domain-containing protein [Streptomyces hoynatensis]|uniref:SAM-dependent methyltransferase n=1 Tax=Streptomyces hoynatensis TaxID=1141874 RepID=A0A3A9ZEN6_9ACTN|nr:SAM-dependent methyltransferase [Streptomyces hoynatensis]RKN46808.1 SAM-dependent methyltransferase [Streptomyces hoynatensis]